MMKSRATFSILGLGAALLVSSSLSVMASTRNLQPKTNWSATMIDGGDTPENGYCALARKYDENLVLTIGQSARDEYSMAIDFQGQKLDTEKPYTIILQAGVDQTKSYDILPASSQAMVMRLGYDESFLNAIKASKKLTARIDGEDYNFNVNDFANGQKQLKDCMAGLKGEPAPSRTNNTFVAEKIEDAAPIKVVSPAVPVMEPVKKETFIAKVEPEIKPEPKKAASVITPKVSVSDVKVSEAPVIDSSAFNRPAIKAAKIEKKVSKKKIDIARVDSQSKAVEVKVPEIKIEPPIVAAKVVPEVVVSEAVKMPEAKVPEVKIKPKKEITIINADDKPEVKTIKLKKPEVKVPEVKVVKTEIAPPPAKADEKSVVKGEVPVKTAPKKFVSIVPEVEKNKSERPVQVAAVNKKYGSSFKPKKAKDEVGVATSSVPKLEVDKENFSLSVKDKVQEQKKKIKIERTKVDQLSPIQKTNVPKPFEREIDTPKVVVSDVPEGLKSVPKLFSKTADKPKTIQISAPDPVEDKKDQNIVKEPENPAKDVPKKKIEISQSEKRKLSPPPASDKELLAVKDQLKELEKENRELYLEARKARGEIDTAVVKTSNDALKRMRAYEKKLEAANADNLALSKQIEEMRRIQEDSQLGAVSGDSATQQSLKRYHEAEREIKRLGLLLEQQRLAHSQEKRELEGMLFDPAVTEEAQRRKLVDLESQLEKAKERLNEESKKVNKIDSESQKKLQLLEAQLKESQEKEEVIKIEQQKMKMEAEKIKLAENKLQLLSQKEALLKTKEQNLVQEKKKLSSAKAVLAQTEMKAQQLKLKEERMRLDAQKIQQAEARLIEVRQKEQQLEASKKALVEKERAAQMKLAAANKKEQEVQGQKRLFEQQTQSLERFAPKEPMRVVSPVNSSAQINKSSTRNIRSNRPAVANVPAVSFTANNIQQLLNQSGLSSVSSVTQKTAGRYSWNAAGLSGKAEVRSMTASQSLAQFSGNYIEREKRNCRGDFASLPARIPNGKTGYEIACVGAGGGKSSSVVFAQKNGNFIAIAHETSAENMDAAIDARDRVASRL